MSCYLLPIRVAARRLHLSSTLLTYPARTATATVRPVYSRNTAATTRTQTPEIPPVEYRPTPNIAARSTPPSPTPESISSSLSPPSPPLRSTTPTETRHAQPPAEEKSSFQNLSSTHIESMSTTELTSHMTEDNAYFGISSKSFSDTSVDILLEEVNKHDVEIKPDGLIYLPEIKYRRILNRAFKPGGWGLAPRGAHSVAGNTLSREYALYVHGRFVSQARGEQDFFDEKNIATAMEGCKSNALMRCCKDLGIASELWDPVFIRSYKNDYCEHIWVKHVTKNTKTKIWRKKGNQVDYPYEETR